MALTSLHVHDVCYGQAGQKNQWGNYGTCCKYLTYEFVGQQYKPLCLKLAPGLIEKKKKSNQLSRDFDKQPDNCAGYKYMKHIDQGYDVP